MLKISVVIPVYKVETYLHQCVDSVLSQTYENIEVILVDDGSPDNCPHICDQYADVDNRVVVIHQRNSGAAASRNTGIRQATGDYIAFLDSDDFWCNSHALEILVQRIEVTNPDVLNFSYMKCEESGRVISNHFNTVGSMPVSETEVVTQLAFLFDRSLYIASAWNKLVRRSVALENPFEEGKTSEDIEWCARLIKNAQSFDFICESFYCYRQRNNSITHSFNEKNCTDLTKSVLLCIAIMSEAPQNRKEFLAAYTAYQLATFFAVQALASNCPKECIDELCKHQKVLRHHGTSKKVACLDIGCCLIGFTNMCRLTRLTRRFWS